MRKSLIITAMAAVAISVSAAKVKKTVVPAELMPTWTEWHDLQVNEVNRYGLHTNFFAYEDMHAALAGNMAQSANYLSLEGSWRKGSSFLPHPIGAKSPDLHPMNRHTSGMSGRL